jgi:hypothetical protein
MSTILHTEKFAGDTLTAQAHGPDFLISVNEKEFGQYTTIEAGMKAAKENIMRTLEAR